MSKYKTNVKVIGTKKRFWRDLYFSLLEAGWLKIFTIFFCVYIGVNLAFALFFYMTPLSFNGGDSFINAFSFSVQTFTTIGYGKLLPVSGLGNVIVMIESTVGLIFTAVSTGIVFTKLARPIAKIRFSKKVLIQKVDGIDMLICRIGNTRSNEITEATVHMTALVAHITAEGESYRKIVDMKLIRWASPFFRFTWTLQHPIDEKSPLYGESKKKIISIIVTIRGFDSIYSSKVSDRFEYLPTDIVENSYFQDVMFKQDDGLTIIDYSRFDELK